MKSDGKDNTGPAQNLLGASQNPHDDNAAPYAPGKPSGKGPSHSGPTSCLKILSTKIPDSWVAPLCGGAAGVASGIVTCPLDVIKTKLQAQGGFARRNGAQMETKALYRGMMGTGRVIFREDGIRGLYQGLGPMLMGYLPTWAIYLALYDTTRDYYFEKTDILTIITENWWMSRGLASLTAGACSTIATNPIWVIKTRLMSQSLKQNHEGARAPWQYSGTIDAVTKMYRVEGIRSFYSGMLPALLGLTHVAIQFPLYEHLKLAFTGYSIGEHPDNGSSHWLGISLATFISKVCASTLTYPHEVLRTRLQTQQRNAPAPSHEEIAFRGGLNHPHDRGRPVASSSDGMYLGPRYNGVIQTCKTILHEEGWRAFYSGIGTNLIRAVPAAMTTMLTYEYLRKYMHKIQQEGRDEIRRANGGDGSIMIC
ncbi:hypothetical protein N7478_006850 [Penicillium angulare]|uniref:uncharacterized protein n=1 Tax=Penicillium angulare TaxID=116970 RepID=UPI0025422705|nr:uncharacterized protein N7478_006850 [Penicillium angulare]KAJ5281478.1 hypothetical protein N7478_006850 [Penicillium angulare]